MSIFRSLLPAGLLLGLGAALLSAQEPALPEPQLPPVIVRPSPTPEAGDATISSGSSTAGPPVTVENFPSLTGQVLGGGDGVGGYGLDSILRGERSLLDAPNFGSITDRGTITERQARDMSSAMQTEVDVLMQQTARGQTSPFIRGLTGQQVLLLVDGIRMNNAVYRSGPNQYFNLVDPGQVDHVEVIRGAQSVLWGADSIGGTINIVTRSPDRERGNYGGANFRQYFSTADTGTYSRLNAEGWVGQGGAFAGGSYQNVNDGMRGSDWGVQPFTHYSDYAGDVKFNYLLGPDALFTFAVQHFEETDLPRSDRFPPFCYGPPSTSPRPTWYDPQQRDLGYLRLQGLAANGLFDAYTATASFQRNKEGSREIRSAIRTDLAEFDDGTLGFNLTFARDFDWFGRLTYGGDCYHDQVNAFRNQYNPVTQKITPDNPQFPNDSLYTRYGGFLSWDVDMTEALGVTTGVRYEGADASGTLNAVKGKPLPFDRHYEGWIPSLGANYKLTEEWRLVGVISEGYRAPNLDDLTADNPTLQNAYDVPSLDVQPEIAWNYEIGFKYGGERLRMQFAEYWIDLQNAILRQAVDAQGNWVPNKIGPYGTVVPGSNTFIRANFDSRINGTEFAAEYLLDDIWTVYGNFWYTYGQDVERNEPFSRIPPMQGFVGFRGRSLDRRRWLDVYTWLVGRQDRYSAQNNIDARFPLGGNPAYATLNLRTGTTLGETNSHRLSLNLENITNTGYRVLGSGVDGLGFNAILGYEFTH